MLKRFSFVLALALVVGLPIVTMTCSPPAVAASYPLTCQIGPPNMFLFLNGTVEVSFAASRGPVAAGLQPGECAWADRAVSASEPHALCADATVYALTLRAGTLVNNGSSFQGRGAALAQAAALGAPKLMTFVVHSSGSGPLACMLIDTYGP